jgi:hypothetical protein
MRFTARSREDFPAVGDWVALTVFDAELAIIHKLLSAGIQWLSTGRLPGSQERCKLLLPMLMWLFWFRQLTAISTSTGWNATSPFVMHAKVKPGYCSHQNRPGKRRTRFQKHMESFKLRLKNVPVIAM